MRAAVSAAVGVSLFATSLACAPRNDARRPDYARIGTLLEDQSVRVDGVDREFAYYVPSGAGAAPLPMVVALHGHGGRTKGMIGKGLLPSPDAEWMRLAERDRFLVFYPQGLDAPDGAHGWNDCREGSKANPDTDDVKFLMALVDFARESHDLDEERVYFTGLSNGGFMALRMALERSEAVAAAAAVVALMPARSECRDAPEHPVSVLFLYGTEDKLVPAEGGEMMGGRARGVVHSAERSAELWIGWNGLRDAARNEEVLPDLDRRDGSIAVRTIVSAGDGGPAVGLYRLEGHGHTAPSLQVKQGGLANVLLGRQNRDIEMVDVIWDFFRDKVRGRR